MQAIGQQPQRAPHGAPVHYERHRPDQTALYRVVQQHAATFFAQAEDAAGADLPQFVKDEFDALLKCCILAHGFLRLRCADCAHDKLVAFSCKRRGLCPSCEARRMAQTAAQMLQWNVFAPTLGAFHQRYDFWLTPPLAGPPLPHGATDPPAAQQAALKLLMGRGLLGLLGRRGALKGTIDQIAHENLAHFPVTQLAKLTGVPAMSVPPHWTASGMPLGAQFLAPMGDEATLLQLAKQPEAA